jgi:hypothetical protein
MQKGKLAFLAAWTPLLSLVGCGRVDTSVGAELPPDGAAASLDAAAVITSVYMEAESGRLVGFNIQSDPTASSGKYILPPGDVSLTTPGDARAAYTFELGRSGTYLLWGRLRAPGAENNAFFVTMDDGPSVRWQLSTGVIWYWSAITDKDQYRSPVTFVLDAGTHSLLIQNSEPLVGLDKLYVTVPGDVPPGNDTPCSPPDSIQLLDGGCIPSCGSHGATTCGAACAGEPPLVSYDCQVCCFAPGGGDAGSGTVPDAEVDGGTGSGDVGGAD